MKKKVKMLPLYEPRIEEAGSRKESRQQRERKHLAKEVKSESKTRVLVPSSDASAIIVMAYHF